MSSKGKILGFSLSLIFIGAISFLLMKKEAFIKRADALLKNLETSFLNSVVIEDFEEPDSLKGWEVFSARMKRFSLCKLQGKFCAWIEFYPSEKIRFSRVVLEDIDIGPKGIKDWSKFDILEFQVSNPQKRRISLGLQIKDALDKRFKKVWEIEPAQTKKFKLPLILVKNSLDLKNISQINFYIYRLKEKVSLYLDGIFLKRIDEERKTNPVLSLVKIDCPSKAYRSSPFFIRGVFRLRKKVFCDYRVFIHIYPYQDLDRGEKRKFFINADTYPLLPLCRYKPGVSFSVKSGKITLPEDFPQGRYRVDMGFFRSPQENIDYSIEGSYGHYLRLFYTNSEIKDFKVCELEVE